MLLDTLEEAVAACLQQTASQGPAWLSPLDDEREFYEARAWALNAYPTVAESVSHLRGELGRLRAVPPDWRRREVMTNIWLLGCAISDAVDDWLLGERYDFSKARAVPLASHVVKPIEKGLALWSSWHYRGQRKLVRWRDDWEEALHAYVLCLVRELAGSSEDAVGAAARLQALLDQPLPAAALRGRIKLPSAFRSQELALDDLPAMAEKFAAAQPDRERPVLIVGCRTAGSYFAPVLRACLEVRGWKNVEAVTIRPNKGTSERERLKLSEIAHRCGLAVLTDEPIGTGATMIKAIRLLQRAAIAKENIVGLLPVHPHRRDFTNGSDAPALRSIAITRLEPEERHKNRFLVDGGAQSVLAEYFARNGERLESVVEDPRNAWLDGLAESIYRTRLKRLYEVRVRQEDGSPVTRYVLAKSVGCGWLGYHAFLAGVRLARFVPPVLGLRDGFLFTEWLPHEARASEALEADLRERIPRLAGQYIAARAKLLQLPGEHTANTSRVDHRALHDLSRVLCKAHGKKGPAFLQRERLLAELRSLPCPPAVLIDGKMRPQEWISSGSELRKSDFEQHAQGKLELNASDPAYDLADTILTWHLSPDQEKELIREYADASGDHGVEARMFHYKLLTGTWTMAAAIENLADARLADRHHTFDAQYAGALDFLTEHTTRRCAELCGSAEAPCWQAPVVVLDVDGVIDDGVFGFPSNTAAGILAIGLLRAHGYAVAFNSARSLRQLQSYAASYGGVGAVAEYGAVVWDAVGNRERVLVSAEYLGQIERLKAALREIPAVFLNADYRYSIRAHVYEQGATAALPQAMVKELMGRLKTDRVQLHQTVTETTLVARETDKGTGLSALLDLAGQPGLETVAIGDSSPDLAMFGVATRSYAPGHIGCRSAAESLGCRVASRGYQRGFLESVRSIVHPDGTSCDRCAAAAARLNERSDLFTQLLHTCDKPLTRRLWDAVRSPAALAAFKQQ